MNSRAALPAIKGVKMMLKDRYIAQWTIVAVLLAGMAAASVVGIG